MDKYTLWITAGVAGILVVASAVGLALKFLVARGAPHPVIDNLNSRVNAWWVMVAVIGLALLGGKTGVILLFAFVSLIAMREYFTVAPTRRGDHWVLVLSFVVVLPFQYWLVWVEWYGLYSIFIPIYAFLVLPILAALPGDIQNFLQRTATIQWGLMISVFCISHVPALLTLDIPGYQGRNAFLLVFLILVVQLSDVLQYVFGKLFGKHKIAPNVSPSKTVEGFVGGGLGAVGIGAALWWITPFAPLQSAAMALVIVVAGFLGGLALSAVKRSLGAKDWGSMIEGHGGMLDRLDSVSFAAPVFFHLVRYFFEP